MISLVLHCGDLFTILHISNAPMLSTRAGAAWFQKWFLHQESVMITCTKNPFIMSKNVQIKIHFQRLLIELGTLILYRYLPHLSVRRKNPTSTFILYQMLGPEMPLLKKRTFELHNIGFFLPIHTNYCLTFNVRLKSLYHFSII